MSKWTGFPALGAAPATGDLLGLIDVSDTTDDAAGSNKKMTVAQLFTSPTITTPTLTNPTVTDGDFTDPSLTDPVITGYGGWQLTSSQPSYTSVDDPTGVITFSGVDLTDILSVGMRIRFVNNGNTIYGIITAISFSTDTVLTFLHEIDPSDSLALTPVTNNPITAFAYSTNKCPHGFPTDARKWSIYLESANDRTTGPPSSGVKYNAESLSIPIGAWHGYYEATLHTRTSNSADYSDAYATLSTANNSESDPSWSVAQFIYGELGNSALRLHSTVHKAGKLLLASKTTYYLNYWTNNSHITVIGIRGGTEGTPTRLEFTCAYL